MNQAALHQAILYLDRLPKDAPLRPHLSNLATQLGCSSSTLRRQLQRYRASGRTFPPRQRAQTWNRLRPEVDTLIEQTLLKAYFRPEHPDLSEVALDIQAECQVLGWPRPSYETVRTRMLALRTPALIARRDKREETKRLLATPGKTERGEHPLDLVATDHSPLDVHLVHPVTRLSLGRATLTLVICTCSRLVLGFLVSFQKPSITSVALALSHAVLPKDAWLRARGFDPAVWPVSGLPKAIQVDNAREFHSTAFETACARWHIEIHHRRKGRPRDGSLMENILGTINRAQHSLPGTTFSNPRERQRYPSEDRAVMSLEEFEVWLTHKVISYNHRRGRPEGWAPAQRWRQGDFTLRPVHEPATFTLDFLPQEERLVTETGIELFTERYWTDELKLFVGQRILVKYDPLNLGHIWVYDVSRKQYLEVPYRDATTAPRSYWTYLAERRERTRQRDDSLNTHVLDHHRQAKEVVQAARQHTRQAKRRKGHVRSFDPPAQGQLAPLPKPQAQADWPSEETLLEPWPSR